MTKIAVFGSAFNPPSLGHKSVIDSLSHFDLVLLVPSISHAWGKSMLDYETRCELIDAFISDLALSNVKRSTVEEHLQQPGESVTTYAVLSLLQKQFPDADITFVIGPDNLFNFEKFYKAREILQRWSVMACPEKVAIRSTDIRHNLSENSDISSLTTKSVEMILQQRRLY
ncbi:nicotinate-nicotinamide nucleotide adenylyltransferase [Vibrio aestuarianus]|uniref:nicotinate-nucleotide adenylyltransferase n=1 Tax=Vibrio aestuarianus TaxID=28171 RepID=A0A9X4J123_9VIBR|nr:nicotinate-nicotinamide nucleotide adenylyltransferase [Vibrio aestuarianus]MDE1312404.1 nicotinate-nicotinamide nucleotide adenylyltransferase [Vibrio aestuarianus]MDE1332355.1 nicotinate-nicotinamide nucleotide adenylyltransferase [Vibrio aestuarianus]MDE1348135.1 nicotinate-nicotinamide nucleotide adenylyltransferase [Vibrio aestuarianus]MDE1358286.1 nicotinate-nicotinamide nucleotide adenylyltransferase [Vibrio aestuarianus]NGZ17193.1 nicotinate-nicotinamide nucleotide adenylyltransfera